MLNARSYMFLFLVPALALSACGGEKSTNEITGAVEEAIPAPIHLAGTYANATRQVSSFSQLVLMTDGTYHAKEIVECFVAPCPDIERDGRYALFRTETISYFVLYSGPSGTAAPATRYQYVLKGDSLAIRPMGYNAAWTMMTRSPAAWCADDHDCAVQELQTGPCAGAYYCTTTNICNYRCGAAPEIAAEGRKPGSGG